MPLTAAPARRPTDAPEADAGGDIAELASLLGFQLRMAQAATQRDFSAAMGALGLTQPLAAILMLVDAQPGLSQIDISAALGSDRATVMALVDRLSERDLVRRSRSDTDRRKQALFLTEAGAAALDAARRRIAGHEARLKGLFSDAELAALMDYLGRIRRLTAEG